MSSKNNITVHTIVKNEEQWIWYALMSVIDLVDKVLVYDTGSTDGTVDLIKKIKSSKIIFEKKGQLNSSQMTLLRQEQVERTTTDWFMLVDGDEVWPKIALTNVIKTLSKTSSKIWGLVVRTKNCVGDVWHYQPEIAGKYQILEKKGHYNIRLYRKLPGFTWLGNYPLEAYCSNKGVPIQNQLDHLQFVDSSYWHLTHLYRSKQSKNVFINRLKKYKLEIGIKASRNELPEIFFQDSPAYVPTPWVTYSQSEKIFAHFLTPLRIFKRFLIK